jgi:hypothetical protein
MTCCTGCEVIEKILGILAPSKIGDAVGKAFWMRITFFCLSMMLMAGSATAQVNVTTWQDDTLRTGQNINENILTPGNLASSNFGQLCSAALDGQAYAQPLELSNVTFNGTQYASLVYVVTQMNTLFVINGTPPAAGNPCTIVTSLSLNPTGLYPVDCNYLGAQNCQTIAPTVGALGTPVIQMVPNSNGTLYVVTENQNTPVGTPPSTWYHYLHAVNLDQVAELTPPVQIFPPGPALFVTQNSYWSRHHIQRPGLLLVGNYLYIAFSMMDGNVPVFNGSLFRYDVTNLTAPPLHFMVTPDLQREGGGIWQGGAGLAYGPDDSGNNYLYFNTGDGTWNGVSTWGDSFIKLDPNLLTVAASFTPADQSYRDCQNPFTDVDFGSGGVLLTPATSNWPYLAISGDKEGGLWVMDRLNPGGFNLGQCSPGCGACSPTLQNESNQNLQTVWMGGGNGSGPTVHNNLAYWNNFVYVAPVNSAISQYQICNDNGSGLPLCSAPVNGGAYGVTITTTYGATPAISATSESTNGILWVIAGDFAAMSQRPAQLYAFNASTMQALYVNSGQGSVCPQVDGMSPATKFSVPTIANGYVYLGTQSFQNGVNTGTGMFYIFGLNRQCTQAPKKSPPAKSVKLVK